MKPIFRLHRDLGLQLFTLYLLLIVPFLAALLISDQLVGKRIRQDAEANDLSLARAIAQETDLLMENALQTVRELASYPSVINRDIKGMEELFEVVLRTRPDVNLVYRLDPAGIMVYHYPVGPGSTVGVDFSFRDYFQDALHTTQPLVSQGRISPTTNQPVATAVMPIWQEGQFLGVVATNLRLESLSATLASIITGHQSEEGFQVMILDSSAQVIAYPDGSLLLKPANKYLPEIYGHVLHGQASSEIATNPGGQSRLYTLAPIPQAGWGVIVSRPTSVAFSTQITLHKLTLVAIITFLLIGLIFWVALNRRVITPIEKLTPISEAIGLNQQIEPQARSQLQQMSRRRDQIGHLIRSIFRMEAAIHDRMQEQAILLETSTAVVSSLETRVVLDRILEQVERLLNVKMIAVIGCDEQSGVFSMRASRGLSKRFSEQLTLQPYEPSSVAMRALNSHEPIQVSDTESDPSYLPRRERARAEGFRALLGVPFNTQHAPPTVLLVFHPKPHIFTDNEIQLLVSFANQATMAIENAALFARSDKRLQEQTHRLEALIQSLSDGLILCDLGGKVIYANRRIQELAGLTEQGLNGALLQFVLDQILMKAIDPINTRSTVFRMLDGSEEMKTELGLKIDERMLILRLESFEVADPDGISIGRGLFFHDITADSELDRMKSTLVSTVSHELRTPLAAIKGYASTLLAEDVVWDDRTQREFISIISDEADRLSNLVNSLLDLSRIEAGSLRLKPEDCRLDQLIEHAVKQAHLRPENKLHVSLDPTLPTIYADRPRLESILRNLVENAIKYAGPEASIEVDVQKQDGQAVFRVLDDGPGIPAAERERVFNSFYRIDDSLARTASGAGLGLAICQGLVRAHGGTIWVEAIQAGACIVFSIPLHKQRHSKKSKKAEEVGSTL